MPVTQRRRLANSSLLELLMVLGVLRFKQAKPGSKGPALLAKAHLRVQVRDRGTREALTPTYDFGCKRPTFSNSYFTAFNKPDVTLETSSIVRFEPDGMAVTADGAKTVVDTLVLATGFQPVGGELPGVPDRRSRRSGSGKVVARRSFSGVRGVTMPKFPNLLSLNSPYSYSGLSYFTAPSNRRCVISPGFSADGSHGYGYVRGHRGRQRNVPESGHRQPALVGLLRRRLLGFPAATTSTSFGRPPSCARTPPRHLHGCPPSSETYRSA